MTAKTYLTGLTSDLYISSDEDEGIKTSLETLKTRLNLYFGSGKINSHVIEDKYAFGSHTRDTMLPRKSDDDSDVDFLVIFEDAKGYYTQTCLNWLKDFAEYWYSTSIVKQSLPTIVIELGKIKFELVPAYKESLGSIYIPSKDNNWIVTQPNEFNSDLNDANKANNQQLKRTIRLLKHWNVNKNYRRLKSFMLEKELLNKLKYEYVSSSELLDYVYSAFKGIRYYSSDEYIKGRIETAIEYIEKAIDYNKNGDGDMAVHYLKKVFPEV